MARPAEGAARPRAPALRESPGPRAPSSRPGQPELVHPRPPRPPGAPVIPSCVLGGRGKEANSKLALDGSAGGRTGPTPPQDGPVGTGANSKPRSRLLRIDLPCPGGLV